MAKQQTVPYKQQFFDALHQLGQRHSLHQAFDDFLTMVICAFSQNPLTKQSHYEAEYLATIAKYKANDMAAIFPKALAYLVQAMEEQLEHSLGNDVLGEFFELHISNGRNGQFFTPPTICEFMASIVGVDREAGEPKQTEPLHILDPSCGSGRMLLAAHRQSKYPNEYYGIDIDRTCVKMTALNLFLNGAFNSEVMCANALSPTDFVISYRISMFPLGIFKVENKEDSLLWNMHYNSFVSMQPKEKLSDKIIVNETPFSERKKDDGNQLVLF